MPLKVYRLANHNELDVFLRGGVSGGLKLKQKHFGLHGLTLVFVSPAGTVTFEDPTGGGLSPGEIIQQIALALNTAAVTTEGSTALSALTMASETLTLFLDGSVVATEVVFGTEAGEVAILAVLNAALNPLGITATAGGSGGVVLSSDATGPNKSIQVTATGGGQAKLTMAVETKTGTAIITAHYHDARLNLTEFAPSAGVELNGSASTAAALLGFGKGTVSGTVYAEPGGSAPKLVTMAPTGAADGIIVVTEET